MFVATSFGKKAPTKSGIFAVAPDRTVVRFAHGLVVAREIAFDTLGKFNNRMFVIASNDFGPPMSIWDVDPDGAATEFGVTDKSRIGSLVFGPDGALYVNEFSAEEKLITVSRVVPPPRRF
jgi:hypothetical protein